MHSGLDPCVLRVFLCLSSAQVRNSDINDPSREKVVQLLDDFKISGVNGTRILSHSLHLPFFTASLLPLHSSSVLLYTPPLCTSLFHLPLSTPPLFTSSLDLSAPHLLHLTSSSHLPPYTSSLLPLLPTPPTHIPSLGNYSIINPSI